MDHPHVWILRGQLVGDRAGAVGAPVVDDGDLDVVGETWQDGDGLFHDRRHVVLFVQCGEEEGEAVEPCGH